MPDRMSEERLRALEEAVWRALAEGVEAAAIIKRVDRALYEVAFVRRRAARLALKQLDRRRKQGPIR